LNEHPEALTLFGNASCGVHCGPLGEIQPASSDPLPDRDVMEDADHRRPACQRFADQADNEIGMASVERSGRLVEQQHGIYVTHDQTEAMTMSDRVAVMSEGEILQVAAPQTIYADPASHRVAEFVGSPKINMLAALVAPSGLVDASDTILELDLAGHAGAPVTLGIRPEAFHLVDRPGTGVFSGRVRLLEHMGSDLYVHLDLPVAEETIIARLLVERAPHINIGQALHLGVQPGRVLVFDAQGRRVRHKPSVVETLRNYA
jgi:multiple sugar transport system ATP-binding protein